MASQLDRYHGSFFSCNSNSGTSWCADCPKCAFTYLALLPWLDADAQRRVFGADFLEQPGIRKWVLDLTVGHLKPWDCVGTRNECQLALALALAKDRTMDFAEYPRRGDLLAACAAIDTGAAIDELVAAAHTPHSIPESLWPQVRLEAARLTTAAIASASDNAPARASGSRG